MKMGAGMSPSGAQNCFSVFLRHALGPKNLFSRFRVTL